MADLTDVATALVGILAAAVYPNGTGQAPAGGVQAKIYQGWPDPAQLKTDLAKHIAHISVWPTAKTKITTRHNPEWQQIIAPAPTLVATVGAVGKTITLTGTVSVPQAVAIVVDGKDYAYGVQANDTLATIAASLAALVSNDQAATVAAGVITIPNAHSIGAQVVANGTSAAEVARELRVFTVSIWASCFDEREPLARVVTPALATLTHLTLADNTGSTVDYAGSRQIDIEQRQGIFRREIDLAIEYATIATRTDTTVGLVLLHRTVAAGTGVTVAGDTVIGNATAVIGSGGAVAPVNTAVPTVIGTPTVGLTLTANTGTWTGAPSPAYTYVWNRGGVAISGATGATYLLVTADLGALVTVTVTGTNTAGNSSATSVAVGPVTSADVTPPVLSTAIVANASPSVVALAYNEALNTTAPATSAFTIGGTLATAKTISSVSISGTVVSVTVSSPFVSTDAPTITYSVPGSNQIKDVAGNNAAALIAQAITNNVAAVGGGYAAARDAAKAIAVANGGRLYYLGTPAELTGRAFSDVARAVQAVSGGRLRVLDDGNDNTVRTYQATDAARPTIVTAANGYCAMRLDAPSGPQFLTFDQAFTINHTLVVAVSNVTAIGTLVGIGDGNRVPQLRYSANKPSDQYVYDGGTPEIISATALTVTSPHVISSKKSGSNVTVYADGASVATSSTISGTTTSPKAYIGVYNGGNEYMGGDIFMVYAGPSALSDADRGTVEAFGALLMAGL